MKTILGARIRTRRRELNITQAELARQIGISSSYLNLIEHNKRSIAGKLLVKIGNTLGLDPEELDGAAERRLLSTLDEIAHMPEIDRIGVEANLAGELIGRYPGWARAIAALARSEQEATENARAMADRLIHDSFLGDSVHKILSGIASVRSSGEILVEHPEMKSPQRNQFNQIIVDESRNLTQVGEALATYFEKSDHTERVLTPLDEVEGFFEARENRFQELEDAADALQPVAIDSSTGSRHQNALKLAEKKCSTLIKKIISDDPILETELAQSRAHSVLLQYAAAALLVPMHALLDRVEEHRFDVEFLADTFSTGVETICHRLAALPRRPGLPRFGYFLANAAGTLISMRNLPDLPSPRYASACPLWVLYRAQQSPETILRQRVLFPSGSRFVFLARARHLGITGFGQPRHYVTDMLAMTEDDATHTVYAPAENVHVEHVGSTCRSCPRQDCQHRVTDPITG